MADSKKIDDGGYAFPCGPDDKSGWSAEYGMSLRDWFAGQALAESTREIWASHKHDDVAKRAYEMADAMIAARKAGG